MFQQLLGKLVLLLSFGLGINKLKGRKWMHINYKVALVQKEVK